jgi:rod shape-determining protein MreC
MTVINGDGLVGRVTTVGPSTSTVLLANDPDFTVGTRLEGSMELGFATGQGDRPMQVQLLNGKADVRKGDRLVTFGSEADKPFVPGVPVGKVVGIEPSAGNLTKTVQVQPFVGFTRLDVVGVVVVGPRSDPRDSVLPSRPTPSPRPTPKKTPATPNSPGTPGTQDSPGTQDTPGTQNTQSTMDGGQTLTGDGTQTPQDNASPDVQNTPGLEPTPTNSSGG